MTRERDAANGLHDGDLRQVLEPPCRSMASDRARDPCIVKRSTLWFGVTIDPVPVAFLNGDVVAQRFDASSQRAAGSHELDVGSAAADGRRRRTSSERRVP